MSWFNTLPTDQPSSTTPGTSTTPAPSDPVHLTMPIAVAFASGMCTVCLGYCVCRRMIRAVSSYLAEGSIPTPGPLERLATDAPIVEEGGVEDNESVTPQEFGEIADQSEVPESTLVFVTETGAWQEVDSRIIYGGDDSDDELIDISYTAEHMTGAILEQVLVDLEN